MAGTLLSWIFSSVESLCFLINRGVSWFFFLPEFLVFMLPSFSLYLALPHLKPWRRNTGTHTHTENSDAHPQIFSVVRQRSAEGCSLLLLPRLTQNKQSASRLGRAPWSLSKVSCWLFSFLIFFVLRSLSPHPSPLLCVTSRRLLSHG